MALHVESQVSAQRVSITFTKGQKEAIWIGKLVDGDPNKVGDVVGSLAENGCGPLLCYLYVTNIPDDDTGVAVQIKVGIPDGATQAGDVGVNIVTAGKARWAVAR